jgi:SAM-dependent methyltransferase
MDHRSHWQRIYRTREPHEVNWYQREATASLGLIATESLEPDIPIIDVGGGASLLVDDLLALGFRSITVLDLSEDALAHSKARLGQAASGVNWICGDITRVPLKKGRYGLWHDRAVLHFLTDRADRDLYVRQLRHALAAGGLALIATFGPDGPPQCSGLPVVRYAIEDLRELLGGGFDLVESTKEVHVTPTGEAQAYVYGLFRRLGA